MGSLFQWAAYRAGSLAVLPGESSQGVVPLFWFPVPPRLLPQASDNCKATHENDVLSSSLSVVDFVVYVLFLVIIFNCYGLPSLVCICFFKYFCKYV
jgi:hypothetical protein